MTYIPTAHELGLKLDRLNRTIAADEVKPVADEFGDGIAGSVVGSYASVRKGDAESEATPGFYVLPGLVVLAGDHVWYYDRGAFKVVLGNLSRGGFVPDELSLTSLTLSGPLRRTGILSPPALTANTNDWAPDGIAQSSVIRLDLSAAWDLTGMLAAENGVEHELANVSAFTATLKHDVTSAPANRFLGPSAVDYALPRNASVVAWYDGVSSRWRLRGK